MVKSGRPTATAARASRSRTGTSHDQEAAVALSTEEARRFAGLLERNAEELAATWTDAVSATLRGRLSRAELHRQIAELQKGVQSALAGGTVDLDGDDAAELRALLSELSGTRARQGFSAAETAMSVFALKDAVLATLDRGGDTDATTLRDYIAFSSFVDRAGLFTFDSYVRGPGGAHLRPGRTTARALHAGGEALGGRRRGAAGRHARLGPRTGGHGAPAADPGGHRLADALRHVLRRTDARLAGRGTARQEG